MSAPELVIFDCDGVLIDSEPLAMRVEVAAIAELGWTLTEEEAVERFVGLSHEDWIAAIEDGLGRPLPQDWRVSTRRRYHETLERELEAVDGIAEALDALAIPTCVASSGTHEKIRFTLGLVDLYERFEGRIFSAEDVVLGKPAPDLFLHAARSMSADPSACVVIEDSRPGVEAARAAGMRVLGYDGSVTPAAVLESAGAEVFSQMRLLPELLGR